MRDAQSLLDQLLAFGGDSLTLDGARQALGLATGEAVLSLTDRLLAHDVGGALALLHALFDQGVDPRQFLLDVLEYLRQLLLAAAGESGTQAQLPSEVVQRLRAQAGQLRPAVLVEVIK
ncbi:MAG TPA: hypothetical protein VER55_14495, partial [Ardenticatenaceae bacterium]|nr:hypothetical protein [Ardenticatenaceae bacterium]